MSLKRPKAKNGVRPTSSLVKTAIFNLLPPGILDGAQVLDAYAGTGALGFEALERGAAQVDFVDKDADMCRRIRESLKDAGLTEQTHVYAAFMKRAIAFLTGPYDVLLMDPPYADPQIGDTMALVAGSGLLKQGGVLVVEHASRVTLAERFGGLVLVRLRRYGDTSVSIYRMGEA